MKLVEEETVEIPSRSTEDFDDENETVSSDISDPMSDISEHDISGSETYTNDPTYLPKWVEKYLSSTWLDVGNLADPRRTRLDFQRAGISLYCNDYLPYDT